MQVLTVKWKDTDSKGYHTVTYRKKEIKRCNHGWIIEGLKQEDENVYHCILCAQNAIDKHLGGNTRRNASKRKHHGIRIIGKKDGVY